MRVNQAFNDIDGQVRAKSFFDLYQGLRGALQPEFKEMTGENLHHSLKQLRFWRTLHGLGKSISHLWRDQ